MPSSRPLAIAESLPDALLLVSVDDGRIRDANSAARMLLGRSLQDLKTTSFFDLAKAPREVVEDYLRASARTDRFAPGAFDIEMPDGENVFLRCAGCGIRVGADRQVLIRWATTSKGGSSFLELTQQIQSLKSEIKRRIRTEISLRDSEARTRTILETAAESIITFFEDGTVESFNLAAEQTFGHPSDGVVGNNIRMLLPPTLSQVSQSVVLEYLGHESNQRSREFGNQEHETFACHQDGSLFPVEFSLADVPLAERRLFIVVLRDIRERRRLEERLTHQANHDHLTGLPNRILLEDRLVQAIESAKRRNEMLALFFIDLDRFKIINDSLGHAFGDQVLSRFAERLQADCRSCDTVARLGGDEFVWLATGLRSEEDAFVPANLVLERTLEPLSISGREFVMSASIGISVFPRDGTDAQSLLGCADAAMYVAKAAGKNTYRAFSPEIGEKAARRLDMETRLRQAISNNELCVHYQPQSSLADGTVRGVEALVRWNDPGKGLIQPNDFIPLAEETGLIIALGAWVLEEACRQAVRWQEQGLSELRMAVNISPRQLEQSDLLEFVEKTLNETGLAPRFLELEVTEGCVMADVEQNSARLQSLKSLGLSISIDDFGTGQSSLAYLQEFPIDVLKIDRCFVKDIAESDSDRAIARTIIGLAHSLGLRVVAEGVETEAQLELLRLDHCDEIQGYFISRPQPASEIEALLFRSAPDAN